MSIPRKILFVATEAIDNRNKEAIYEVIKSLEDEITVIKRDYSVTLASLQILDQKLHTANGVLTHLVIKVAKAKTFDIELEREYENTTEMVNNLAAYIERVRHKGVNQREAMDALHKSTSALRGFANSIQ